MKPAPGQLLLALLLFLSGPVLAGNLMMVRSPQTFPEAMLTLQSSLSDHGYTVSRVQRVDIGLTGMGYQTDKYRIVFFGKPDEIRQLKARYPELIPYLPPKISIFAEGEETLLVTVSPIIFRDMVPPSELSILFDRWTGDLQSVFEDVTQAE